MAIIFGVIFRKQSSRAQLSRGNYPGDNFPRDPLSGVAIFLGDNFPWGNYPGGNYPRGNCPGAQFSSDAIARTPQIPQQSSLFPRLTYFNIVKKLIS